jgi:hypothetical protein
METLDVNGNTHMIFNYDVFERYDGIKCKRRRHRNGRQRK